jgi:hypothetical protein
MVEKINQIKVQNNAKNGIMKLKSNELQEKKIKMD